MALITPLLATPIIPIIWALDDARVKSWSNKTKTTWTVSSRYKRRFNTLISIGAIISNLKGGIGADQIVEQITILSGILQLGAMITLISVGFFLIYYFAWFRNFLRTLTVRSLSLKCYEITLVEKKTQQFVAQEQENIKKKEEIAGASVNNVTSESSESDSTGNIHDQE